MTTPKRTGLAARSSTIQAAMAASPDQAPSANGHAQEQSTPPPGGKIGLSVRLNPRQHDALRRISYDERVSIHTLLLEGVESVIGKHSRGSA
jgi:hypothetical protein